MVVEYADGGFLGKYGTLLRKPLEKRGNGSGCHYIANRGYTIK